MSDAKCRTWLNGSLRNYILFASVILAIITAGTGGGWSMYARLDDKIAASSRQSYSRQEGELLEESLKTMRREGREDFTLMNNKLDVLLGIKPRSVLNVN